MAISAVVPDAPGSRLARSFFARQTYEVARELLGCWLLRKTADGTRGGLIVETEAYGGPEDMASHARAGRTQRTEPMFGEVGHAYVYLVYGMHNCLNVVAYDSTAAQAGAVLIRAFEPRLGFAGANARLGAGPALVCRALGVTRAESGTDLVTGESVWLASGPRIADTDVSVGSRIGVSYAGDGWQERPWRFWIAGNPAVSRQR